jgi:AcrR family transcriptional regulator
MLPAPGHPLRLRDNRPAPAWVIVNNQLVINKMVAPTPPSPADDAAPRHKRARRKDARPGELLDAALDLFVEKGFAATRVEEVAARAGVSKGTLFLYFPSKVELFQAVVREAISGRFDEWNAELEQFSGSTADLVLECMLRWWQRIGNTRASGITKLVLSEACTFPEIAGFYTQAVVEPGNALIRRILQRGVARGEFRDIDLHHATLAVLSPMIFLTMWKHSLGACANLQRPLDPEAFIRAQADIIVRGLLQHPDTLCALKDKHP